MPMSPIAIARALLRAGKSPTAIAREIAVPVEHFQRWTRGRYGRQGARIETRIAERYKRVRCPICGAEALAALCSMRGCAVCRASLDVAAV